MWPPMWDVATALCDVDATRAAWSCASAIAERSHATSRSLSMSMSAPCSSSTSAPSAEFRASSAAHASAVANVA